MHIGIVSHVSTSQLKNFLNLSGNEPKGTDGATAPNLLVIELLKLGYKLSIFSLYKPEPGQIDEEFTIYGENVTIYYGTYDKSIRKSGLNFFKKERHFLTKKILEVKPDILHAHWQYEYSWAAIDTQIPTIVTARDSPWKVLFHYKNFYRFIRLIIAYRVLIKANNVTATSQYLADEIKKMGISKDIHVIPNFEPEWLFEKKIMPKDISKPIIIMINNGFDDRKNVTAGIKAFQILREKNSNSELHLYGKGYELGGECFQWAENHGLNANIKYMGYMNFEELMDNLSKYTLLLHTSKEETFGNILTESMALGVPVIGGEKSGAVPWVIGRDKVSGRLVDINNPSKIAEAISDILVSKSVYENYVKFSREEAKRFSASKVVEKYVKLYEKISNYVTLN